jgi:NAD(P)-dependent dehydrogenase (short-subunit alcohol dehydrogenase family)
VLITGASGGIGSACLRRLASNRWTVFAGVRRRELGEALAKGYEDRVVPVMLDVTSDESIRPALWEVNEHLHGRGLDGLVNSAGLLVEGPVELLSSTELREQFEVNVIGAMAVTREFLPLLRKSKGRIVNVGSVTGRTAVPYLGASSASKAALCAFNDALRVEVAPFGIAVSLIEPTPVATEIFAKAAEAADRSRDLFEPDVRALYQPGVEAVRESVAMGGTAPVEVVVEAIESALISRRPKTRYPVGKQPRLVMGLRFAPDRLRDRLVSRELGLHKVDRPDGPS